METLRQILEQADTRKVAVGHFNVSDLVTLKAVFESARDLKLPVIVGASEGERQFLGIHQISALVANLREQYDFPIFLVVTARLALFSGEQRAHPASA